MKQEDVIEVHQEQTGGVAEDRDKTNSIKLKLVYSDKRPIHFQVKLSAKMGKLKKKYEERVGLAVSMLRYVLAVSLRGHSKTTWTRF